MGRKQKTRAVINKTSLMLKNKQEEKEQDRLTALPLDMRYKVLSLLPAASAVKTCLLSREWKCSWKSINRIRLQEAAPFDNVQQIPRFIGHVLEALDAPLDELDLDVNSLALPACFFTCRSLKTLKLRLVTWVPNVWDPYMVIHLPNLISLDACAHEELYQCLFRLISGSPALKSVSLCGFGYVPGMVPVPTSSTIKHLEFQEIVDNGYGAIVDMMNSCPSLETLVVGEVNPTPWVEPSSPPPCMVEMLKAVKVYHEGEEQSNLFVRYVLGHAKFLKKLELVCAIDMSSEEVANVSDAVAALPHPETCEVLVRVG